MRNLTFGLLCILCLFIPVAALAGDLDSPAAPTEAGSAMYTVEDIYNRLNAGTAGTKRTTVFTEPGAGTGSTMHTLNDIMAMTPEVADTTGAVAAGVLNGKTFWGLTSGAWGLLTGTMPINTLDANNDTVTAGYYEETTLGAVDTDLTEANIITGKTIFGKVGSAVASIGNAVATDVLASKTFSNNSSAGVTGTMPTNTLNVANDTVTAGYYEATTLSTMDSDLAAGNVKDGVNIFGIAGTYTGAGGSSALVARTGQTTKYDTGDDGDLEKGVAWPNPRFTVGSGDESVTVTDNLTGLIWAKNANIPSDTKNWADAITYCNGLTLGGHSDWRLPNRNELLSLIDLGSTFPALPDVRPFTSVQSDDYWSSSTYTNTPTSAWNVGMHDGSVGNSGKMSSEYYVWPVRGGQ